MGAPLVYFFKETLGFGGSSNFTILSYALGFGLMIAPGDFLKKFYKPNLPALRLGLFFLGMSIIYMVVYNNDYTETAYLIRDVGYYIFIFTYLFLIMSVSNEIKDYFLPLIVVLTFIGSIALVYSIVKNPHYMLGQRATVQFGDGSTESSGNPHVYARNGYAGIIASYLYLKVKNLYWRIFTWFNLFFSGVIILLTQTRAIFLSTLIIIAMYFFYGVKASAVRQTMKSIFTPRNLLFMGILLAAVIYFISTQQFIINILSSYSEGFYKSFLNAMSTALGLNKKDDFADASAMGRVTNLNYFADILEKDPWSLILGKGYRHRYMDMPVLESLVDCGIPGFLTFFGMNMILLKASIREMKKGDNPMTTFLAYFYISYFVGLFTAGRPVDTAYWFVFVVMIRFVGIKYLDRRPLVQKPETSDIVS